MRNTRWPSVLAFALAMALVAAACSNSKAKVVTTTTAPGGGASPAATAAPGKHVKVDAPGVTDTEIRVGGVAAVTNPLGGQVRRRLRRHEGLLRHGQRRRWHLRTQARARGASATTRPSNNKVEVQGLLTQDHVFAVLPVATLLFTGAQTLVDQAVPTFGWTINPEWEGSQDATQAEPLRPVGIVPLLQVRRTLRGHGWPSASMPTRSACSPTPSPNLRTVPTACGTASPSTARPPTRSVAFTDKSLSFGVGDLSVQVSKMKQAGVDLVTTCMDTNGVVTLAKEMKKQQLKAVQYLPNAYDHDFLDEFGDLFEGSVVRTDFVQFEAKDKPKGLQTYLDAMDKAGVKPSENSLVGWLNADLFVAGLRGAGPDFSRQKVIDAINKMTELHRRRDSSTGSTGPRSTPGLKTEGESCQFLSTIHDSKFDPDVQQARQALRVRRRRGRQARSRGMTSRPTRTDRPTA